MLKPPAPPMPSLAGQSGPSGPSGSLPPQPFFALGPQRVRLARERYFDQGQRPTGLVPEPVIQSWARCLSAHQRPQDAVAFDPVSRSRMHATLARNRHLLLAASDELQRLESTVGGTGCRVLLTDADGVVVHATSGPGRPRELLPIVSRVGVNLAEAAVGTNAPAVVLKTGQACTVSGAEHFFDCVQRLQCAAAPIRDATGAVAGVLDLTVEDRPFGFYASALVAIVATAIENRLLQQGSDDQLVLHFQVAHNLMDSPLEALVGLTSQGRLAWANSTAQQLLGLSLQAHEPPPAAETLFGQHLNALLALVHSDSPQPCRLPNGLTVWMRARGCGQAAHPTALSQAWPTASATARPAPDLAEALVAEPDAGRTALAQPAPTAEAAPGAAALCAQGSDAADGRVPAGAGLPGPLTTAARTPALPVTEHMHAGAAQDAADAADAATADAARESTPRLVGEMADETAGEAAGAPAVPTLVDHQRELIDKVLAECQGNISRAARRLGVSRGLLYRRRRDASQRAQASGGPATDTGSGA